MRVPRVFLSTRQREIASAIVEVIRTDTVEDSFTAMISIMAASLNGKGDNGPRSQVAAAHYAEMLINTVILSQSGLLQMNQEAGRSLQ